MSFYALTVTYMEDVQWQLWARKILSAANQKITGLVFLSFPVKTKYQIWLHCYRHISHGERPRDNNNNYEMVVFAASCRNWERLYMYKTINYCKILHNSEDLIFSLMRITSSVYNNFMFRHLTIIRRIKRMLIKTVVQDSSIIRWVNKR